MPKSEMKVKSGNTYEVNWKIEGNFDQLTEEQKNVFITQALAQRGRAAVLAALQSIEPAIVTNLQMFNTVKAMMTKVQPDVTDAFILEGLEETAKASGTRFDTTVPTTFAVKITDLVPSESSRGRAAADPFSYGGDDEEEETATEA